jgi:hypothetical protein
MMAIAISLPLVVLQSLVVSAALVWLNRRGVEAVGAAVGTIAVCVGGLMVQLLFLGQATLTRQAVMYWLLFVIVPSTAVFAASRASLFRLGRGCSWFWARYRL